MSWFASQEVRFYYLVFAAWKVTRTFKKRASAGFPVEKYQRNAFHWQDNTLVWTPENFKYLYAQSW